MASNDKTDDKVDNATDSLKKEEKDKLKKEKPLDISDLMNDSICKKWIFFSTAEPKEHISTWYKEKQDFWNKNREYLENKGFKYGTNINGALDFVKCEKETKEGLEGCLLVIRIGSEQRPATKENLESANEVVSKALKGTPGVRVLVTHHEFHIEKISLPQLRTLQSRVLESTNENMSEAENANPIIGLEL